MDKGEIASSVIFLINGEKHILTANSNEVDGQTMLVDYIRNIANLKGTKVMCREGGCGACCVRSKVIHPSSGLEVIKSVNSCLTPVLSCDGWDISTVESLGNKHEGYHKLQNRLVNFHGTQCGACTPGFLMYAYSLLESNQNLEVKDIENNLDGNICRCTGYRPILDAFKTFAKDVSVDLQQKCDDIEDCGTCPLKSSNGNGHPCENPVKLFPSRYHISLKFSSGEEWLTAKSLQEALVAAYLCNGNGTCFGHRFVAGNTSTGIFKNEGPYKLFIDINSIPDLKVTAMKDKEIVLGGGCSLAEAIRFLKEAGKIQGFEYGSRVAKHLGRVANAYVRNNGTVAGNLMIKHAHPEFPSDVFTLMEAIGASVNIASLKVKKALIGNSNKFSLDQTKTISMMEFLETDMKTKLIVSISLPKRDGYHFRSFKITRRYQNAHAYVNAALLLKVNKDSDYMIEDKPRICFGGIAPSFVHASQTEMSFLKRSLTDGKTLNGALEALENEGKPETRPLEASADYRVQLTKSLLYKTILEIIGENAGERLRSGGTDISRNLQTSKQVIDSASTDTSLYKNIPKCEATIQASGEAEYTDDIPLQPNELYGVYVLSTVGSADLKSMDASEALKIPGVARFITAADIPGVNNGLKFNFIPNMMHEPVFAADKIYYHGQALGLILATSRNSAIKAAKLVKVTYENVTRPVVNIEEAIEKAKADGVLALQTSGTFSTPPVEDIKVVHNLKGTLKSGSQYPFYMELISCVCHPREDGIDVYTCTQWIDQCQSTVADVLGIPANSVNVQVRRLGGGFGGKISRTTFIASACAVATWVTNRPVRIVLDLETSMSMLGKREPYSIPYEDGRIGSLKMQLIGDTGYTPNDAQNLCAVMHCQSAYKAAGWDITTNFVKTNTPSSTTIRAPGSINSIATMEWIMEHIAHYLKKDALQVREINLIKKGDALLFPGGVFEKENMIPEMLENMKQTADYERRKADIEKFNKENRWKKRGLSVVPVRIEIVYYGKNIPATVKIFHTDGHVAVAHGGIEMGQGLNTKIMQTVAHSLQIPLNKIKVKPSSSFSACNGFATGGSIGSELACYSAMKACEELRENLRPILEKLESPTWEKLIEEAHAAKAKLFASYVATAKDDLKEYDVWILNLTEVEIDVLTGEYKVVRTDLYEDTGKSLSPGVDLGQIEGGYIFGQGLWTTEKIVHDENTGKLLTNSTWDYKPPEAKDIPEDFRITLINKTPNPYGVLRSKATGEPSTNSAFGVVLSLRNAIASARADAGNLDWFEMSGPVTPEDVARLCLTKESQLTLW